MKFLLLLAPLRWASVRVVVPVPATARPDVYKRQKVIPVTVVEAGPCVVTQKKTVETDGYVSVQLCFGDVAEKKLLSLIHI